MPETAWKKVLLNALKIKLTEYYSFILVLYSCRDRYIWVKYGYILVSLFVWKLQILKLMYSCLQRNGHQQLQETHIQFFRNINSAFLNTHKTLLLCGQDSKCCISVKQLPKSATVHLKYHLETMGIGKPSWEKIFLSLYFVKYVTNSEPADSGCGDTFHAD